jgi:outer membrane protein assembly factor BamB
MKIINNIALIILCGALCVGCSKNSWFGKDKALIKGERIKVSTSKQDLKVDELASKQPFNASEPKVNTGWYKSSGITSSQIDNLYLNSPLDKQNSFSISSANDFTFGSTPIIVEDKLYVSSTAGTIESFDLTSGQQLWANDFFSKSHGISKFSLMAGSYVNGGLSYYNNTIYATGGLSEVAAINPLSGEVIWHTKLSSPSRSTPVGAGKMVIIQTVDNKTFALDSETGKTIWSHLGIGEDISILATYAPAVSDRNVIIQYSSGEIFALSLTTGDEVWAANISSHANSVSSERHLYNVITSPTVDNGLVLAFGNDGTIAALKVSSGELVWKKDIGVNKQFWVSGNYIYAVINDNQLVCLNKPNGKVRWITDLNLLQKDGDGTAFWGSPIIADSKVMVANSDGLLVSFDMATGSKINEISVSDDIYLMPIVVKGSMYLLDNSGKITRYGS